MYVWNEDFIIPFQSVDLVKFDKKVYFYDGGDSNIEKSIEVICRGQKIVLDGDEMNIFLMRYKEYLRNLDGQKNSIGFQIPDHCSEMVF